ncbi:hypothetical protein GCM10010371_04150 [Streptomyces subrutilus]|uniref:Uncharacterized protein n=1 Tax=Streptomyces subrutilus TaxID=36818 RepID=A0A918QIJ8_9ACTN|nr:hypothetical protein GCM10010371_04150 [Streptomyces subrutilus]
MPWRPATAVRVEGRRVHDTASPASADGRRRAGAALRTLAGRWWSGQGRVDGRASAGARRVTPWGGG